MTVHIANGMQEIAQKGVDAILAALQPKAKL